eukprot:TRINITY_DN1136_c0_g1_i1.p2 TRINITY_DN1136_c0_g1~~TRINITY_DN1136_c0_g1_i1.p2  ORF type:complete len:179 (+),score=30.57 TRINITY_DN1136_c0_g1_i1:72-539(+)
MEQQCLLKTAVTCSAILYLKFLVSTLVQGTKKFGSGSRAPEDAQFSKGRPQKFGGPEQVKDEKQRKAVEADLRWGRIVANDLESLPFGILFGWVNVFYGSNKDLACWLWIAYTVARVLHTVVYAYGLQPHRALFWTVGVLSLLGMIGNLLATVFF